MTKISEMAGLIKARGEQVNAKRDTDFGAASADFISKAGDHVAELDAKIVEQADAEASQQGSHDDNFIASKDAMNAKIANFESNADPSVIDSLAEQAVEIIAADGELDNSILGFKVEQGEKLAALELLIGNETDVIAGMSGAEGGEDDPTE